MGSERASWAKRSNSIVCMAGPAVAPPRHALDKEVGALTSYGAVIAAQGALSADRSYLVQLARQGQLKPRPLR